MSEAIYQPGPAVLRVGTRLPASIRDDPGAVVRAAFEALRERGDVTDALIAAADPSNPMHDAITWDDLEAADKQRIREMFYLLGSLLDAKTGEPIFVSTYRQTNNAADARRIHINVRLLPPRDTPRQTYTINMRAAEPRTPLLAKSTTVVDMPSAEEWTSEVVEDPSLDVFKRWVESHKHQPTVLRAAWRILRDAL